MAKFDKNLVFKYILFGYLIIYAILLAKFNKFSERTFSNRRSLTDLVTWIVNRIFPPTVIILGIHYWGCRHVLPIVADKCIIAAKYQFKLREKRITLVSTHLFKFLYFTSICCMAYDAMYDVEWLPREFLFGKSGQTGHDIWRAIIWDRKRFAHHLLPPKVQRYFEWSAAYHLHSTIWHLWNSRALYNFYEMLLHHFVTLSLIGFCYLTGHTAIGVLVSILHDATDVPGYAIKLVVNTSSAALILSVYVVLLSSWIYYRVICFACYVIYPIYCADFNIRVVEGKGFQEITVYVILLSTLCMLHMFWIYLMFKIGYQFITQGKKHDVQETKRSEYSDTDSD